MAQFYNLYVDTYSGGLVQGPTNTGQGTLPKFFQGDTISLRIYLLERNTTYPYSNPFSIINNASISCKVALGPKNGSAGSTLYTQQYTWSKDANNTYFYADLPLNTAAINTLIGAAESATAWFEIEITQGGYPSTVFQQSVTIEAEVIETASVVTPPGATAMTAEEANAIFLKRTVTGAFYLQNPTTGAQVAVYLGDDNVVHFDPVA